MFDFFAKPLAIEGDGRAERLIVERTELDENGGARGTGETYEVPASLIVSCIGYSTPPIDGVPYDERGGKFLNDDGRIADRLYCVGWARRGPTGTIGTNRPDGYEVAEPIAADNARRERRRTRGRRRARAPARRRAASNPPTSPTGGGSRQPKTAAARAGKPARENGPRSRIGWRRSAAKRARLRIRPSPHL